MDMYFKKECIINIVVLINTNKLKGEIKMGDLKNVQLTDLDLDVREIDSNIDVEGGGTVWDTIKISINHCTVVTDPLVSKNGGNQCVPGPTPACNASKGCQTACSGCQTMGPCHY